MNGQGLCARCNLVKQLAGWSARTVTGVGWRRHAVELTTPTGHTYRSTAPPVLPGLVPTADGGELDDSPLERHHLALLTA